MQITGQIKKIRFQKPDSAWGIFEVKYKKGDGTYDTTPFTGVIPMATVGQTLVFDGEFVDNEKYGEQFKFKTCYAPADEDESEDGALALLSSSRFKGIGPKKAQAIVNHFGKKTLAIIKKDHMRLTEVPGISSILAISIHDALPDIGVWGELRMLLKGSTDNAIDKIYQKFGNRAVVEIKKNPYVLIEEVDGFGFLKADAIAASVGIVGDNPLRVQAALFHCLDTAANGDGHCFSYVNNLQANVERLIPGVNLETIANAIKELTKPTHGKMQIHVDPDGAIYLQSLWNAEVTCAEKVSKLVKHELPMGATPLYTPAVIEHAAESIMYETGIMLDETQKSAIVTALNQSFCVITGGPGTGKTTIIRTIIKAIEEAERVPAYLSSSHIMLMAPTGRAARRMKEATGHEAMTIHRSLPRTNSGLGAIEARYVIVDETSMVDIYLAANLLRAIDENKTKIIFIGDVDQLPPVGPGVFFRDIIKSYKVPTVRLKFSFRQNGSIARNANAINNGEGPHSYITDDDFQIIKADKDSGPDEAVACYLEMVEEFGVQDAVILSPKRVNSAGGTINLNRKIQAVLNPLRPGSPVFETYDYQLRLNDRVMLTQNGIVSDHANGDLGTLVNITKNALMIMFDGDSAPCELLMSLAKGTIILAYATTVHKSQGSEYNGVVFLFTSEHQFFGERAIIYTAVTRAKKKCAMVCDSRAVTAAIAKVKPILRNSKLEERINALI